MSLQYQLSMVLTPEPVRESVIAWKRRPIWEETGAIFVHIPKCAGTSINAALYGRFMGHIPAHRIRSVDPELFARLPVLSVVRNPWSRCVSAYRFAREGAGTGAGPTAAIYRPRRYRIPQFDSFARFVEEWLLPRDRTRLDYVFRPQHIYVEDKEGNRIVPFIGRTERLGETQQYLSDLLGRRVEIGTRNVTPGAGGDYREWYDPRTRDLVAQAYARDIAAFGYDF